MNKKLVGILISSITFAIVLTCLCIGFNKKAADANVIDEPTPLASLEDKRVNIEIPEPVRVVIHTVTFLDAEGNVDFTVGVEHGKALGYIPDSDWDEGILDYWSHSVTGERLREDTPILEDVTYKPNYIYIEWLILNALEDGGLTLDDVSTDNLKELSDYIKNTR